VWKAGSAAQSFSCHSKPAPSVSSLKAAKTAVDEIVMITDNDSSQASDVEQWFARRSGDLGEDAGFTLIELMVVLLILAILLAIAIPTFLGVTKSANDRAAQSNLNTAFVNAKAAFQQNSQSYAGAATLVASLTTAEPSLSFITGTVTTSTAQSTVSVNTSSDGASLVLSVLAKSTGNCWYLVDNTVQESTTAYSTTASTFVPAAGATAASGSGFPYQAGTWYGEVKNAGSCGATVVPGTEAQTGSAPIYFQSTGGFPAL
jgi:type IV pilus assembly protein PilA